MAWRRRLVGVVLLAAACTGHTYDVGIDGAAGEAGAAGESAEPVASSGGNTSVPAAGSGGTAGSAMGGAGGSTHGSGAGTAGDPAGGANSSGGRGGSDTAQPTAGAGGGTQPGDNQPDTAGDVKNGADAGAAGADDGADSGYGGEPAAPVGGTGGTGVVDPDSGSGGIRTGNGRSVDCALISITTKPDLSPTDQCIAHFACGAGELEVSCDGENDGSGTSLCDCRSGELRWQTPKPIQGEAPLSCNNGMIACFGAWPAAS